MGWSCRQQETSGEEIEACPAKLDLLQQRFIRAA
jgi:hypothetical protein